MRNPVLSTFLSLAAAASAQPGSLDPTFGDGGTLLLDPVVGSERLHDCLTLPDNTILVCGYGVFDGLARGVLYHLLNDGTPDPDFGADGFVVVPGTVPTVANAVVLDQEDGIIIGGITAEFAVQRAWLARYLMDGTLDTLFGNDGIVIHDVGGSSAWLNDIAVAMDGRIVGAGAIGNIPGQYSLLTRYGADGTLDPSFGGDGIMVYTSNENDERLNALVPLPDGGLLAAGDASIGGVQQTLLIKALEDGSPDTAFGGDGTVMEIFNGLDNWASGVVLVDSSFLISGGIDQTDGSSDSFIAKFRHDGSLDPGFGEGGKTELTDTSQYSSANDLALQADGKVVVVGRLGEANNADSSDVFLVRLMPDGSIDTGFGVNGIVNSDLTNTDEANAVAIQPDGRIVACGLVADGMVYMLVGRYLQDACVLVPSISSDNLMLCPNGTSELTTGTFDTYQWYKNGAPIPGATAQTLTVTAAEDAGSWFKVETSSDVCTAMSDSVLVDGYVFLPPFIINEGDQPNLIGDNGEQIYCQGDDPVLVLGAPYDTNVQWSVNGEPIPGANDTLYAVPGSGNYTVEGAPAVCPDFIQDAGVTIEMDFHPYVQPTIYESGILLCPQPEGLSSQWYYNGQPVAGFEQCVIPIDAGNYTVFVDYGDSCSVLSAPFTVVGLAEHTRSDLKASPVPTPDRVTITWAKGEPLPDWRVTDVTGRVVRSGTNGTSPLTIDLSALDVGRYRFLSGDGRSLPLAVTH